jgi:hypothetical protein
MADQADLFAYEGYIASEEKLLSKRIWRFTDAEWWILKLNLLFTEGE